MDNVFFYDQTFVFMNYLTARRNDDGGRSVQTVKEFVISVKVRRYLTCADKADPKAHAGIVLYVLICHCKSSKSKLIYK